MASSSSTTSCAPRSPEYSRRVMSSTRRSSPRGFAEAIVIVKTILGEPVTPVDYDKVPWVVYCRPEVAWCGLTEEQARERGTTSSSPRSGSPATPGP